MELSEEMLQQALALFRQEEDELGQIETLIAECWRLGDMIDPAVLEELAAKIEHTPELVRADQIASYHAAAEWYYLIYDHDWPQVTHHLLAGFDLARQTANRGAIMTAIGAAARRCFLMTEELPRWKTSSSGCCRASQQAAYHLLQAISAYISFYRAQLDQAEAMLNQVEAFLRQIGGQAWVESHVTWLRLSLLLVRRNYAAFAAAVGEARTRMAAKSVDIEFLPGVIYLQARAAWVRVIWLKSRHRSTSLQSSRRCPWSRPKMRFGGSSCRVCWR